MRKRRKPIAQWLFLFVGVILFGGFVIATLPFLVRSGWLNPKGEPRASFLQQVIQQLRPSEEQLRFLAWLGGIAGAGIGAAVTLLASWHFAEMNLPRRFEEMKKAMLKTPGV